MSDTRDDYEAMRQSKQERHTEWHCENMKIMNESGIQYEIKNNGEALVTPIKATFYPSTGRWTYKRKMFRGGAKAFVSWYTKTKEGG